MSESEEEYNVYDDMKAMEVVLRNMDNDINILWEEVIMPYKKDQRYDQILDTFSAYDSKIFKKFMQSSPAYQTVLSNLKKLKMHYEHTVRKGYA